MQPRRRGQAVHARQIRIDDGDIRLLAAGHRCYLIATSQFRDNFNAGYRGQQRHQAGSHQHDFLGDEDPYRTPRRRHRGHIS